MYTLAFLKTVQTVENTKVTKQKYILEGILKYNKSKIKQYDNIYVVDSVEGVGRKKYFCLQSLFE